MTKIPLALAAAAACVCTVAATRQDPPASSGDAADEKFVAYTQAIAGTELHYDMLPIPGGTFRMGSPETEAERGDDEGPQRDVRISPFWMGKCEVTWDEYDLWSAKLEIQRRPGDYESSKADVQADAVSRPTPPYTDMTFGMGHDAFPAICMTQHAALQYCEWLSRKTGHFYRLPTEAEWEYACRAGTKTTYYFGDDPDALGDYEWFDGNADEQYRKVGQKKPNPWGLHDMLGNVAEWCIDGYAPYAPARADADGAKPDPLVDPVVDPTDVYPRVARGGSWQDYPEDCRAAKRRASEPDWKEQDPQLPQSIWYHTDADFLGFRVVRPLNPPPPAEWSKWWHRQTKD